MALGALVGIVTVLLAKEPYKDRAYREEREKLPFKPRLRRFLRNPFMNRLRILCIITAGG